MVILAAQEDLIIVSMLKIGSRARRDDQQPESSESPTLHAITGSGVRFVTLPTTPDLMYGTLGHLITIMLRIVPTN